MLVQAPPQEAAPSAHIVRTPHETPRANLVACRDRIADWCAENGVAAVWDGCRTTLRGIHWHHWRVADAQQAMLLCLAHGDQIIQENKEC